MIATSSDVLLDDRECPICGTGQLLSIADPGDPEAVEDRADWVCASCCAAVFVDPPLVAPDRLRSDVA